MRFRILNFGFWTLVSLGFSFANEAVFSTIFPNKMKNTAIEQQSSKSENDNWFIEVSSGVFNQIGLDDLESIITNEFAQGLPSDTELDMF
ncbi:MAG: hypothetical protein RMY28_006895 [Nostoc sp. ChiSLP01]|nr:hypothetical protein [Nostoc sp. CmiSLP01]MDZ8282080.1 hypothetical protein [Nostoc sp. ChiSLP01]